MSAALKLIERVEANGGCVRVEGDWLVIAPDSAALPILDELRRHKGEIIRLLESRPAIPAHDPAPWAEDFHRWALTRCRFRDRCFGGIGALLSDFAEWAVGHDSVPMSRETLEALLRDAGFLFADGLVYGLILKEDLKPECILHPDVLLGEEDGFGVVDTRRSRRHE